MRIGNLVIWALCALAALVVVAYDYRSHQAVAMPHYLGPDHPAPDTKPFLH